MAHVNGIGQGNAPQNIAHAAPQQGAAAPAALHGARPSRAAVAGRVVAGILTLGLSEVIRAVVRQVRADANAPAPRVQTPGIPAAPPDEDLQNAALAQRISRGGTLPPACEAALQEGVDELRNAFGDDIVPQGATFGSMPCKFSLAEDLAKAIARAEGQVTPQQLREMVKTIGSSLMAEQVLQKAVADTAQRVGYERKAELLRQSVQGAVPGLDTALKAATNRQEAEAVVAGFATAIEARVTQEKDVAQLQQQEEKRAVTLLAEGTGLSEETIRTRLDDKKLYDKLGYLGQDFLTGKNTAQGEARANAFRAVTDDFVRNKLALWYSVDSLQLSPQQADAWKERVLTSRDLGRGEMLTDYHRIGSQTDATPLLQLLQRSDISAEEITGYMQSLSLRIDEGLQNLYGPQAWQNLGAEGQAVAREFAAKVMIGAVPGLPEALQARATELQSTLSAAANRATDILSTTTRGPAAVQADTLFKAAIGAMFQLPDQTLPAAEHNGQLARSLGQPGMSLPHLQAVEQSIVEARIRYGEDCLPAGTARQALNAYDPVTRDFALKGLEKAIRESAEPVSSDQMARLTAEALHNAAVREACISILHESARTQGLELNDSNVRSVMDHLAQRHPDLWRDLGEAENRADLQAQLASLPEVNTLLRLEADMQAAWADAMNSVYARLSQATGLPEEDLRARLDVRDLENGSLLYLRQNMRDSVRDPELAPDAFPATGAIREQFQALADRFVAGKSGLYDSLDAMPLSAALKEEWKEKVLSQSPLKRADFLAQGMETATRMRDNGLTQALTADGIDDGELLGLFRSVGAELDEHMLNVLGDRFQSMGSDDSAIFSEFARQAFLDLHPELCRTIQGQRQRVENLIETSENQMIALQHQMSRQVPDSPQMLALRQEFVSLAGATTLMRAALAEQAPNNG